MYKSLDSGANWTASSSGLTPPDVTGLEIDPANPATLYASTHSGVYKSVNGGSSWSSASSGLTTVDVNRLLIDPATPTTLYAATQGGGMFKTTSGATSWSAVNSGLPTFLSAVALDPTNPSTLYAGSYTAGVYKSVNAGGSWSAMNTGLSGVNVSQLAVAPGASPTIHLGSYNASAWQYTTAAANNPVPTITSLSPASATPGTGAFTLSVSGTNFLSTSVVRWNGADRTTAFVDSTHLSAAIPAADIASAGTADVTVFNPAPGGGTSNVATFAISATSLPVTIALQRCVLSGDSGQTPITSITPGQTAVCRITLSDSGASIGVSTGGVTVTVPTLPNGVTASLTANGNTLTGGPLSGGPLTLRCGVSAGAPAATDACVSLDLTVAATAGTAPASLPFPLSVSVAYSPEIAVNTAAQVQLSSILTISAASAPCGAVSLSANPVSPQNVGTAVTISALATPCSSPLYQFWIQTPSVGWTVAQPYSASTTWNWSTSGLAAGDYQIAVWTKQSGSTAALEWSNQRTFTLQSASAPCTAVSESADPGSPQVVGAAVTVSALATGCATPTYQFWVLPPGGGWGVAQAYSASGAFNWSTTGLAGGTYQIAVWARRQGSTESFEYAGQVSYNLTGGVQACNAVSETASPGSPQPAGVTVHVSAAASPCSPALYQFWLQGPGLAWTVVQAYSTSATWDWNTTGYAPGAYQVAVWAKAQGSTATLEWSSSLTFNVN